MNYYEELGLSPSASPDEIRQAYRMLARLLHPDQCSDEQLRSLSELQMKRLNLMVALLTDPLARDRYDAGLESGAVTRMAAARLLRTRRAGSIVMAGVLVAGGSIWLLGRSSRHSCAADAPAPASPATSSTDKKGRIPKVPNHRSPGPNHLLPESPPAAQPETTRTQPDPHPPPGELPARSPMSVVRAEPIQATESSSATNETDPSLRRDVAAPHATPGFAGNWFYLPGKFNAGSSEAYEPLYIELRITERDGNIRGRYHARYRVTDRAISPAVSFTFEGPAKLPAATLPWTGAGGASGRVALRLASDNTLEVRWQAHHLSEHLGLVAGIAGLLREMER